MAFIHKSSIIVMLAITQLGADPQNIRGRHRAFESKSAALASVQEIGQRAGYLDSLVEEGEYSNLIKQTYSIHATTDTLYVTSIETQTQSFTKGGKEIRTVRDAFKVRLVDLRECTFSINENNNHPHVITYDVDIRSKDHVIDDDYKFSTTASSSPARSDQRTEKTNVITIAFLRENTATAFVAAVKSNPISEN